MMTRAELSIVRGADLEDVIAGGDVEGNDRGSGKVSTIVPYSRLLEPRMACISITLFFYTEHREGSMSYKHS